MAIKGQAHLFAPYLLSVDKILSKRSKFAPSNSPPLLFTLLHLFPVLPKVGIKRSPISSKNAPKIIHKGFYLKMIILKVATNVTKSLGYSFKKYLTVRRSQNIQIWSHCSLRNHRRTRVVALWQNATHDLEDRFNWISHDWCEHKRDKNSWLYQTVDSTKL